MFPPAAHSRPLVAVHVPISFLSARSSFSWRAAPPFGFSPPRRGRNQAAAGTPGLLLCGGREAVAAAPARISLLSALPRVLPGREERRGSRFVCFYDAKEKDSTSSWPILERWDVPWKWQTVVLTMFACGLRQFYSDRSGRSICPAISRVSRSISEFRREG